MLKTSFLTELAQLRLVSVPPRSDMLFQFTTFMNRLWLRSRLCGGHSNTFNLRSLSHFVTASLGVFKIIVLLEELQAKVRVWTSWMMSWVQNFFITLSSPYIVLKTVCPGSMSFFKIIIGPKNTFLKGNANFTLAGDRIEAFYLNDCLSGHGDAKLS